MVQVSSLESELDRVGGDYANERRQLRDAEQSLRDALDEVRGRPHRPHSLTDWRTND